VLFGSLQLFCTLNQRPRVRTDIALTWVMITSTCVYSAIIYFDEHALFCYFLGDYMTNEWRKQAVTSYYLCSMLRHDIWNVTNARWPMNKWAWLHSDVFVFDSQDTKLILWSKLRDKWIIQAGSLQLFCHFYAKISNLYHNWSHIRQAYFDLHLFSYILIWNDIDQVCMVIIVTWEMNVSTWHCSIILSFSRKNLELVRRSKSYDKWLAVFAALQLFCYFCMYSPSLHFHWSHITNEFIYFPLFTNFQTFTRSKKVHRWA
jgi:hypothetical protein